MKTLIINGSPRKNGDSITLVNEMTKFLEGEVKIVNLETANIIFNHMNTKSIGTVYTLQTDDIPAKENTKALNKACEFAFELNRLHIGSDI